MLIIIYTCTVTESSLYRSETQHFFGLGVSLSLHLTLSLTFSWHVVSCACSAALTFAGSLISLSFIRTETSSTSNQNDAPMFDQFWFCAAELVNNRVMENSNCMHQLMQQKTDQQFTIFLKKSESLFGNNFRYLKYLDLFPVQLWCVHL